MSISAPAAEPHQHALPPPAALDAAARAALEASGERWTDLRARVFETLRAMARPVSAYDVSDALSARLGRRIAPNSVYRILDMFVAASVATRVESRNAYVANIHPGCAHDCIFLVCDACGGTTHLDDDHRAAGRRAAARATGFTPLRPVIEVRGRCEACS